jgi:hypothetical protein
MQRFIHRENLRLLREKLAHVKSDAECKRIVAMIEDEVAKGRASDGRKRPS